jgi:intracellular sulfur oxidation DsrE/DsrF family protein
MFRNILNIFSTLKQFKMQKTLLFLSIFLGMSFHIQSQEKRTEGKIIKDFGQTFAVNNPEITTDTNATLKVIFDVSNSSEDKSVPNKYIVTAARFLNMHANEGMKVEQLKVAMTIHGSAWQDVLSDAVYNEKYGVANPNLKLIDQLTDAGVEVIICGQTAAYRKMDRKDVNPNVKFALSAMTALLQFQNDGYRFIKF